MDADQEGARRGIPAAAPHVELCVPSALDASLAPPGRHVVTLGFRSQPYRSPGPTGTPSASGSPTA